MHFVDCLRAIAQPLIEVVVVIAVLVFGCISAWAGAHSRSADRYVDRNGDPR